MSDRKPTILPAAVALTLLGLYVGAYYATVISGPWYLGRDFQGIAPHYSTNWYWDMRLSPIFRPIHWLDRRIRPLV